MNNWSVRSFNFDKLTYRADTECSRKNFDMSDVASSRWARGKFPRLSAESTERAYFECKFMVMNERNKHTIKGNLMFVWASNFISHEFIRVSESRECWKARYCCTIAQELFFTPRNKLDELRRERREITMLSRGRTQPLGCLWQFYGCDDQWLSRFQCLRGFWWIAHDK